MSVHKKSLNAGISAGRHLEYASGFLELGLKDLAAKEIALIPSEILLGSSEGLSVMIDLKMAQKSWAVVVDYAREYTQLRPRDEKGWISWAYSLRELQRIEEAREVLLRAEALHGKTSALLHYNLACYFCLLGDKAEANTRLERALRMQPALAEDAKNDPDLVGLS